MIRVLIVDDSSVARAILSRGLSRYPDIQIIGESPDVFDARDKIVNDDPDVITLDIRMPKMDGVDFLTRLMPQYPKPVVVVSALDRLGAEAVVLAMEAGAVDVVAKPGALSGRGVEAMIEELADKVRSAAAADVSHWHNPNWAIQSKSSNRPSQPGAPAVKRGMPVNGLEQEYLIAVGASTGGTVAIAQLLNDLPPNMPGIVIALHMPPVFTEKFADRLNRSTPFEVMEARDGDLVKNGRVLIAPGDKHLSVVRFGNGYKVKIGVGAKVNGHRPSVGVLFSSVAQSAGSYGIGVILTGMGRDGAVELKSIRAAGGHTVAQDQSSSVVWGMPAEAVEAGSADTILPLDRIGGNLRLHVMGAKHET